MIMSCVHCTGEVFDYLVAHGRMKEKEARAKFRQVCYFGSCVNDNLRMNTKSYKSNE